MSIKLVILKTGEQIVADVKELVSSPNEEEATLHAYLLSNAFRIEYNKPILLSEQQTQKQMVKFGLHFHRGSFFLMTK